MYQRGTLRIHVAGTPRVPLQCPEPGNRDRRTRYTLVTLWGHAECPGSEHRKETVGGIPGDTMVYQARNDWGTPDGNRSDPFECAVGLPGGETGGYTVMGNF